VAVERLGDDGTFVSTSTSALVQAGLPRTSARCFVDVEPDDAVWGDDRIP
jgi:hypothetical protein